MLTEFVDAHLLGPLDRMRATLDNAGPDFLGILVYPLTDSGKVVADFLLRAGYGLQIGCIVSHTWIVIALRKSYTG
jgi:hypothetical protein